MATTGRSLSRWTKVYIDDSGSTLREIPVNSINGVGLECPAVDISAWQDAIRSVLLDRPECTLTLAGPFDSTGPTGASTSGNPPALSGSHTILAPLVGLNVPLAFGVCFGVRHYYTDGEPAFGLNWTTVSGFMVRTYNVNPEDGSYTAELVVFGIIAPSWINAIPLSA